MQEVPVVIDRGSVSEEIEDPILESQDIVDKADDEAMNIIRQAQKTAEQCLNEAQQQATLLKQQAQEEGRLQGYQEGKQTGQEEGYQEGFAQGKQVGRAEMDQIITDAIAKTEQMLAAREQEGKDMIIAAERQIVDMALAIARKILAYEIAENPMVVLPLVKTALEKVSDQEEVVIRVSVDDFDSVLMAKKDLQTMVGREHSLKIIVDSTIQSGSCIIDTSYGEVDARVDTQFETIKKALQGVA